MFAFCLKPRGLEVPNKCSKHRSQKKFRASGHAFVGDQDRIHTSGKLYAYLMVFHSWSFPSICIYSLFIFFCMCREKI